MAGKQIEFPEKQTHDKRFEQAIWLFCAACIVFVILAITIVDGGSFG